jgi:predicted nucleotidyltransferase
MMPETPVEAWRAGLYTHLPLLGSHYGVRQLWLFGPHARGEAQPGTPVDILADLEHVLSYAEFHALQALLGEYLGIPVELVLKGSLNPTSAEIILPELVPLFPEDSEPQSNKDTHP